MASKPTSSAVSLPKPPWSPATEWIAIFAAWSFLAALEFMRRAINPFGPPGPQGLIMYVGILSYFVWALLTPLIFEVVRRLPLEHGRTPQRMAAHALLGLITAILFELANFVLVSLILEGEFVMILRLPNNTIRLSPFDAVIRLWFLDEFVIYLAVLAVGFARNYFIRLSSGEKEAARLQADAARLEAETASLQAQLADARLSALRMQINPHFLFNTLHAISSLADEDPEGVQRIVARLSTLLRRALEGTDRQEVSLEEELGFIRDYLEIQRVRFQDRLEVVEEIDPDVLGALVPNLILQPLVENAIKHGAPDDPEAIERIVLHARHDVDNDRLVLAVRDNGPGMPEGVEADVSKNGRVGLANTRARLEALYGPQAALELTIAPEGGLAATILLPYHTAEDIRSAALI